MTRPLSESELDRAAASLRAAAARLADAEAAAESGDADGAAAALRQAAADVDAARHYIGYARIALRRARDAGGAGR